MSQSRWDKYKVTDEESTNKPLVSNSSRWDKYRVSESAQPNIQNQANTPELPTTIKTLFDMFPSMMRGMKVPDQKPISSPLQGFDYSFSPKESLSAIPERARALGRGFSEVGQGAKQFGLELGESTGAVQPGTSAKYTQEKNLERDLYNQSPEAKDQIGEALRMGAKNSPLFAFGLPAAGAKTLLGRILWGGAGGAGLGGTEFLPDQNVRSSNIIEKGIEGAALGAVPNVLQKTAELPGFIKSLGSKINPKDWVTKIRSSHDKLLKQASDIYDLVKSEVVPRGVGKINVSQDLINEASSGLANTRANKKLIEKAKTGDYEALFDLQSDLGKKGTEALSSKSIAEKNLGEEILDTREKINDSIKGQFIEYGHEDLAKLLEEANAKYRKMKETYYSHPTIGRMVNYKTRKTPKNIPSLFSEESEPMKKLFAEHPEIQEELALFESKKKSQDVLKNIGKKSLIYGLPAGLGAYGYNKFSGD